jgi:GTP-binding protein
VLSITRLHAGGGEVKMFSALKKQGVDEVAQLLWQWAHPVCARKGRSLRQREVPNPSQPAHRPPTRTQSTK